MGGAFPGGDLIQKKTFVIGADGPLAAWEGPTILKSLS